MIHQNLPLSFTLIWINGLLLPLNGMKLHVVTSVFHLACTRPCIPKLTSRKEAQRGKFHLLIGPSEIWKLTSQASHTHRYKHVTALLSTAATPVLILLYLFCMESEDICCTTFVTAWQTNFKEDHIYSCGSNLFSSESISKLWQKFQAQCNPNWILKFEYFLLYYYNTYKL